MTKQDFCECMKLIKEQYDLTQKMLKGLTIAYGSRTSEYANYNISSSITRMVKILTKAMDDTEEWIEYYLLMVCVISLKGWSVDDNKELA